MSKKLLIASAIAFNSLCVPFSLNAAETPAAPATAPAATTPATSPTPAAAEASTDMTKDSWLGAMAPMLPDLICKGFIADPDLKKRFDELKMSYDNCVKLIPESAKKCQDQIYASIPAKIDDKNASVWGKNLGECIGKDFAEKHLVPKS